MLKQIKLKRKLIELSKDKNEIKNLELEIYSLILGYFSCKKDRTLPNFFSDNDTLIELEDRIKNILNTNYKILGIKDNTLDSFYIFIKNIKNDSNEILCDNIIINFINGYNYYNYIRENNSIFDYILLHKYDRLENKLIKKIID